MMKQYFFVAKNSLKLKDGEIQKGAEIKVSWADSVRTSIVEVAGMKGPLKISNFGITKLLGKKVPSENTLRKWNDNGTCKTILGNVTEPDGRDEYNSPSWLLSFGLI